MKTRILIIIITAVLIGSGCYNDGCEEESSQEIRNVLDTVMHVKIKHGDTLIYRTENLLHDTLIVESIRRVWEHTTTCSGNIKTDVYSEYQYLNIQAPKDGNDFEKELEIVVFIYYPGSYWNVWIDGTTRTTNSMFSISGSAFKSHDIISGDSIFSNIYLYSDTMMNIWFNTQYGVVAFQRKNSDFYIINEVK